ncbi:MAG: diguanylate cyclase/phosphodiesterase with PAS/PAC sensor(s) [Comamonadaceae bacterium]|nr:MAG: diguanylate cyclase/phosphodiesterase with PAS/PAC sensor(s) [Comamonadaceae bacterium]
MSSRPHQLRKAFVFGLVLFVAGMLTLTAYTLWRLRADALENGLQVSALHSRSFEDFLTQSLRVSELTAANTAPQASLGVNLKLIENTFLNTLRSHAISALLVAAGRVRAYFGKLQPGQCRHCGGTPQLLA